MSEISAGLDAIHPIVVSSGTDWGPVILGALATLAGAFGGAWLGGKKGYEASLQAGKELTRQSKMEECLVLLHQMERYCTNDLDPVVTSLRKKEIEEAKEKFRPEEMNSFEYKADLVRSLIRLHAKRGDLEWHVEELEGSISHIKSMHEHVNRLHLGYNEEEFSNASHCLSGFVDGCIEHISTLRNTLEKLASTE